MSNGFFASPQAFSSQDETWRTPINLYKQLDTEFSFTLDACALQSSTLVSANWYGPDHPDPRRRDCLTADWRTDAMGGAVFMNPPYGRTIGLFMRKAYAEANRGCVVVCLVPARTDTAWYHDTVIASGAEVRFIRGRLRFNDGPNSAPFPSCIAIMGRSSPE